MKALSIIGIVMSLGGLLTSLFIMSEARCYCHEDYLFSTSDVPDVAISGSLISMLIFVFFLVFSIVATAVSFSKKTTAAPVPQPIPPYQQQPYQPYPGYPQYGQQRPQYPPYNQPADPYRNPQQYPPQNPYPNPNTGANPPQNPPPGTNTPPQPPPNPWAPKD
jgi:hypothetical protein